ncbi:MAG: Xanthine dehydrogenase, molybdenum binding subunit, partial [uncultured Rubrobacteraceae bacterium]
EDGRFGRNRARPDAWAPAGPRAEARQGRRGERARRRRPQGQGRVRVLFGPLDGRDAPRRDAPEPAPVRGDTRPGHHRGRGDGGRPRGPDPRGRAGPQGVRHGDTGPARARLGEGTLPGRARRRRRRRPPRDGQARPGEDTGRVRDPRPRDERRGGHARGRAEAPPLRQRAQARQGFARRPGERHSRRGRLRRVRGRDAGPGVPRPRVRARGARRSGGLGPLHLDPVAAHRQGPGCRVAGARAGSGAPDALRRRGGVRGAGGPLDADPLLHARPGDRPPGAHGLQPRGVVLRPRPPPPVQDALRAR